MTTIQQARRSVSTGLALLFILPMVGCGGSGGDTTSQPPPAPPPPAIPPLAAPTSINDGHQVGDVFWPDGATATGGQGQTVSGLSCGPDNATYHVHAHLSIFMNGRALAIPARIGLIAATPTQPACNYSIHTHDLSGKVHVEAPAPAPFTLGQLFAIWGQTLSPANIAGITSLPVVIYVTDAGATMQYTGDPAAIELVSHREITIQIGSPVAAIPNFTWSGA